MKSYRVASIPGDGIGIEVIAATKLHADILSDLGGVHDTRAVTNALKRAL